jgi:hypothetical protein
MRKRIAATALALSLGAGVGIALYKAPGPRETSKAMFISHMGIKTS